MINGRVLITRARAAVRTPLSSLTRQQRDEERVGGGGCPT